MLFPLYPFSGLFNEDVSTANQRQIRNDMMVMKGKERKLRKRSKQWRKARYHPLNLSADPHQSRFNLSHRCLCWRICLVCRWLWTGSFPENWRM